MKITTFISFLFTLIIFASTGFSQANLASPIVITFDNPTPLPTDCNDVFTEQNVPMQFIDESQDCSFTYSNENTDFYVDTTSFALVNATLSADLSNYSAIEKIEVDAYAICNNCTQVVAINNGKVALQTSNVTTTLVETVVLENPGLLPIDEMQITGNFIVNIYEFRIFLNDQNDCVDSGDSDSDGVCDNIDLCSGFDDNIDRDGNNIPDYCDVCETNRTLIEPNLSGETLTYSSRENLASAQPIFNGADIRFEAGDTIALNIGFEVEANASFSARINTCALM